MADPRTPQEQALAPERPSGIVGQPIDRVDAALKVGGRATYAHEYRVGPAPACGVIVTSTIGRGRITAIDTAAAEGVLGVLTVYSHRNAPKQAPPDPIKVEDRFARSKPQFTSDQVRHFGEPVALVVAETFEQANEAASLVRIAYAPEPASFDLEAAQGRAEAPEELMPGVKADTDIGQFDEGYAAAEVKLDERYTTPYQNHNPIEPHASVAVWKGAHLTVFCSSQIIASARQCLARTLAVPLENVRVISRYIGGGFGGKLPIYADAILAALAARDLRRPVKIALSRQQMFGVTTHRPHSIQRVRLAASRDGTLQAIGHESLTQTTRFDEFIEPAATCTRSLYAAPHRITRHRIARLDLPVADSMRAPGESIGLLALEQAMDELAVRLEMDPLALRLRNEPTEDPERKVPFSTRGLVACMTEGAARFGWNQRQAKPASVRDGDWLIGLGMAAAIRPNYLREAKAQLQLEADGSARAMLDMTDIGTGTYTILTQIVADGLGLAPSDVEIALGDSNFPKTPGSGGSFGASSAGAALQDACAALRSKLARLAVEDDASPLSGAGLDTLRFVDGRIIADNRSESYRELLARRGASEVEATGSVKPGDSYKRYSQHSFGSHFAEVAVNLYTGEVRVRRMLGVFAAGRILNPKTARSQLIGGMIWGIGSALHEESVVDPRTGAFVNRDLAGYHVPVHADIPDIDAQLLPEFDAQANALGSKGIGELGICGSGAAVANAVYNACGARVRDYPITLDKILAALPELPT